MTSAGASPKSLEPVSQRTTVADLAIPRLPRRTAKIGTPRRDKRQSIDAETGWSKPWLWRVVALLVVLLAFLAPRLTELDRMVTPDEPIWLARSANFYEAISSGDLASTYQFAHPGVTTMWLGAAGFFWKARDYSDQVDGQISQRNNRVGRVLEELGYRPLELLVASRTVMILGMALVVAIAFMFALRLMTFFVATLGFLLVALDPFTLGLSRLLHVDALAGYLMLLTVLAGTVYLVRGHRRFDLIVSGVAAGLAVLTRSQMGVLVLWFGVMLLIEGRGWRVAGGGWLPSLRLVARPLMVWGLAALTTCVVLWPALWVHPARVAKGMLGFAETAAIEGHERVIFFAGKLYDGDPGAAFYPAAFLWRITPVVLAGVIVALIAVMAARQLKVPAEERDMAMAFLLAAAMYTLMMTLAAKKFDRYLFPVFLLAMMLAAWGMMLAARQVSRRISGPDWAPAALIGGLALVVQAHGALSTSPYYLSYYNTALGGAEQATGSMMIGWGEGLDQVAGQLNALSDSEDVVLAAEIWPSTIGYFFEGGVRLGAFADDPNGLYRWGSSDYYLLYVTSLQRGEVYAPFLESLAGRTPVTVTTLNGVDYVAVYEIRDDPIPAYMERGRTGMVLWDGLGRMVASTKADQVRAANPGDLLSEHIYFDNLTFDDAELAGEQFGLRLTLVDARSQVISSSDGPLELQEPVRHGLYVAQRELSVPVDTALGEYALRVEIYSVVTGEPLQPFSFRYGDRLDPAPVVDTVQVVATDDEADALMGDDD